MKEARSQGQTVIFSGHVLSEVEAVSDRLAILRRGRLMHVEDMQARRSLRMLQIRFPGGSTRIPGEARADVTGEHGPDLPARASRDRPLAPLAGSKAIQDVAIGTEDLHSLYDRSMARRHRREGERTKTEELA